MPNTTQKIGETKPAKLMDRVRGKLRLLHDSIRMEESYCDRIEVRKLEPVVAESSST
jgi:hypothetical protein